jgi:hypothetical protein
MQSRVGCALQGPAPWDMAKLGPVSENVSNGFANAASAVKANKENTLARSDIVFSPSTEPRNFILVVFKSQMLSKGQ